MTRPDPHDDALTSRGERGAHGPYLRRRKLVGASNLQIWTKPPDPASVAERPTMIGIAPEAADDQDPDRLVFVQVHRRHTSRSRWVMGRISPPLSDSDEGHAKRLSRVQKRTQEIFASPLAQDPQVLTMGTQFTFGVDGQGNLVKPPTFAAPDLVQLAHLAMLARPFTLRREEIHYEKVSSSLLRFSITEPELTMSQQLDLLWTNGTKPRMYVYVGRTTDGEELIPGGTNKCGDRRSSPLLADSSRRRRH